MIRVVIVGGSDAGISAALRARELDVTAVDRPLIMLCIEQLTSAVTILYGDDATFVIDANRVSVSALWWRNAYIYLCVSKTFVFEMSGYA